jgi:hypothetical protein
MHNHLTLSDYRLLPINPLRTEKQTLSRTGFQKTGGQFHRPARINETGDKRSASAWNRPSKINHVQCAKHVLVLKWILTVLRVAGLTLFLNL